MYLEGNGFRQIERLLKVSQVAVYSWVINATKIMEEIAKENKVKKVRIAELDKMWTFVQKKRAVWVWLAVDRIERRIIEFYVGDRKLRSWSECYKTKLADTETEMYYSDYWSAHKHYLIAANHIQSKAHTYTIEGSNSNVRRYLKIFCRKNKCYSKSLEPLRCSLLLLINKSLILNLLSN